MAEIMAAFRDGKIASEIARERGWPYHRVYHILRREGGMATTRTPRSFLDRVKYRDRAEEIVAYYRKGQRGVRETARHFGFSYSGIHKLLWSAGVLRPSHRDGRVVDGGGYVRVLLPKEHRFYRAMSIGRRQGKTRYVMEHRLIMAEKLGRPLRDYETVHHKDGDRQNNRLGNLQLRQGRHGNGVALRCRDCGSVNVASTRLGGRDA